MKTDTDTTLKTSAKPDAVKRRMQRLVSHLYHCWRLWRLAKMMRKSIRLDQKIDKLADNIELWETKNVNL